MADNMIELVASLNVDDSAKQINTVDIPKLQKKIEGIKIKCELDNETLNNLQKQLGNSVKRAKIELPEIKSNIDAKTTQNITNNIVSEFNKMFGMVGKIGETSKKEFDAQTKQMLQNFKSAWQNALNTGDFKPYQDALDNLSSRIQRFSKGDVQQLKDAIDEIRSKFTDGSTVSVGKNLMGWLENATGSNGTARQYLDAIYGRGNYTIGKGNVGYDTLFKGEEDAVESIIQAAQKILEYQSKIKSEGWGFEEVEKLGASFEDVESYIEDSLRKLVSLPELPKSGEWTELLGVDDIDKATEEIHGDIKEVVEQTEYWRRQQELVLQEYEKTVAKIEKAKLSVDEVATREEVTSGATVNYNERFKELMSRDITNATELKEAKDLLSAINKEFQILNAQTVSDLPQNVIENLIQGINKADSQIKILTVDYQKLNSVPQNLKNSFQELQKLVSGFDFSTDFQGESKESINEKIQAYAKIKVALNETQALLKVAQKEEAAFNKEFEKELRIEERINKEKEKSFNKEFEKALKEEEKQLAVEQRRVEVAKQLREEQQHDYWQGRFEESVKGMTAENQVLKDMKKYYEDLEKAQKEVEKQEKKTFQEDNRVANLQNRIKRLTAVINSYASANKRAVESTKQMSSGRSFADEWSRITSVMAKGADLTDRELKDLSADMAVFRKEAQAAGLAGESAWGKFLNSFKTMSSYITANMVFNFAKRQIRDMVNEVTAIDTAMTELRKVTEATNAEFETFAKSAGQTGRELGASISDVINATSTFSRAGFNLPDAEELGKVATLYKNVGDGITIDSASESIISVMKAFNIEAENSIGIIDRINEVSNRAAIDSGGLGLALQRVASAMDAANNSLDETIALTTVSNEIVQNPEMVA